jgi:hypothetical protein
LKELLLKEALNVFSYILIIALPLPMIWKLGRVDTSFGEKIVVGGALFGGSLYVPSSHFNFDLL